LGVGATWCGAESGGHVVRVRAGLRAAGRREIVAAIG